MLNYDIFTLRVKDILGKPVKHLAWVIQILSTK